jgi:hypothetical protein
MPALGHARQRDNADEPPVTAQHGQVVNLPLLHEPEHLRILLILKAREQIRRHHLAD